MFVFLWYCIYDIVECVCHVIASEADVAINLNIAKTWHISVIAKAFSEIHYL